MDLLTLGKDPVAPDKPAGGDARYDPAYEELQAEVDKPPSASGGVDWGKVVKLASEILAQKSKDLLVASYLAVALIQTKRFEGLEIGCRIYRDLVENHWEALFPAKARMRGRIAAIQWWAEKAEGVLETLPKGPYAEARIDALREDVDTLDRFLSESVEDAPSLRPLLDFVGSLEAIAPPPEPKPAAPKPAPAPAGGSGGGLGTLGEAPAAAPVEAGPVEVSSPEDAQAVLEKALTDIGRVAAYYRGEGLGNPMAYRLSRIAAWAAIEALPPSENGTTMFPPPDAVDDVRGLLGEGQEEALVRTAEEMSGQNVLWLDPNFWASEALVRLGDDYAAAAAAIRGETAHFVGRFPGIEDLKFSDGTPFAADDTREWIKGLAAGGGAAAGAPGKSTDPTAAETRKARDLIAEGKTAEAIRKMQQRLRASQSRRDAYLWRIALCRILLGTPETRHALPHVEEILRDIDFFHIEEYDPELALKGLKVAWEALRANAGAVPDEKIADVMGRIARVDISAAMSLGSE